MFASDLLVVNTNVNYTGVSTLCKVKGYKW